MCTAVDVFTRSFGTTLRFRCRSVCNILCRSIDRPSLRGLPRTSRLHTPRGHSFLGQRHGGFGSAERTMGLSWRMECLRQYDSVAARVIASPQKLFTKALNENVRDNSPRGSLKNFLYSKGFGPEERATCFQRLGKTLLSFPSSLRPSSLRLSKYCCFLDLFFFFRDHGLDS